MSNLSHQFQLFNPGPREAGPYRGDLGKGPLPKKPGVYDSYDSAFDAHQNDAKPDADGDLVLQGMEPNPLYTPDAKADFVTNYYDAAKGAIDTPGDVEGWMPTEKIRSPQENVYRPAIQDLKDNNVGPAAPNLLFHRRKGQEPYLTDGNHRANAAAESGQLFVPATFRLWR